MKKSIRIHIVWIVFLFPVDFTASSTVIQEQWCPFAFSSKERKIMKEVKEWMSVILDIHRYLSRKELLAVDEVHRMAWDPMTEFQNDNKRKSILKNAGFSDDEIEKIRFWPPVRKVRNKVKLEIPTGSDTIAQKLKAQGFGPAYTRGIDELNEAIVVHRELKRLNIDPYTTHIDYFVNKMRNHIAYIEKGVKTPQQKKAVNRLRMYMNRLIKDGSVTYDRWIKFNVLAADALFRDGLDSLSNIGVYVGKIDEFPESIMWPTTPGELGIMTLNRGLAEDITLAGLPNKIKIVDGYERTPLSFLEHDILDHGDISFDKEFHSKFMERVEGLPTQKRKHAEVVYFILAHERGITSFVTPHGLASIAVKVLIMEREHPTVLRNLLDVSTDKKVEKIVRDFMDVFFKLYIEKEIMDGLNGNTG